jgi:hypothetical protein
LNTTTLFNVNKIAKIPYKNITTPVDDISRRSGKVNVIPLVNDPLSARASRRSGLIQKIYAFPTANPNPNDAQTFDPGKFSQLPLIRDTFSDKNVRRSGLLKQFNPPILKTPTPDETARRAGKVTRAMPLKTVGSNSNFRSYQLSNYDSSLWNLNNQANLGQLDPAFNTAFTVTSTTISGGNTQLTFNPTYGSLVAYFQATDVIKLTDASTGYSALIQINAVQSPYSTSNAYIQVATSALSSAIGPSSNGVLAFIHKHKFLQLIDNLQFH